MLFSNNKDLTGRGPRWVWIYNSLLGLIGTFLNGHVLYVFIRNKYKITGLLLEIYLFNKIFLVKGTL